MPIPDGEKVRYNGIIHYWFDENRKTGSHDIYPGDKGVLEPNCTLGIREGEKPLLFYPLKWKGFFIFVNEDEISRGSIIGDQLELFKG